MLATRSPLALLIAVLLAGCGAAATNEAAHEPGAETLGPVIDLSGPVTLERLETLAVERRGLSGTAARDMRWEVARWYAKYVAASVDTNETAASVHEIGGIDDALRARVASGAARALDAQRTALWAAEWREYGVVVDLGLKEAVRALNGALLRQTDAALGPPAVAGAEAITTTRDDMLRDAMATRNGDRREVVAATLDVRLAVVTELETSLARFDADALPKATEILAQQSTAYAAGQVPLTDVETAVRGIWRVREIRVHMLEELFLAIGDVERLVGHPLALAAISHG